MGAVGDLEHVQRVSELGLETLESVDHVMPFLKPYRLAAAERRHGRPTVLDIGGRRIGGGDLPPVPGPGPGGARGPKPQAPPPLPARGASPFPRGAPKPRPSPLSLPGARPGGP